MSEIQKALLFYNPKSGHSKVEHHCELINEHFKKHQINIETILVPKPHQELEKIIESAISEGVSFFIAAGGDGTVSMIGTHLVGKETPLAILPLGTGNLLAKTLIIPQKLEQALDLITNDEQNRIEIDTFKMGERHFLINVSVGVSPKIMESVGSADKQRLGFFAYLINFIQQLLGLKLHRIFIDCDHKKSSHIASEILLTNIRTAGIEPLTWSDDIALDDGSMDLLIFRAANVWDILGLVVSIFTKRGRLNPIVKFLKVKQYCHIDSQSPLHTQADGDVIGKTPFEIKILPKSLTVIAGQDYQANN
jgi:diacylglycerol kinase (ATP)